MVVATLRRTEQVDRAACRIDARAPGDALELLLAGQLRAAACVDASLPEIAAAVALALRALEAGGRLFYLAAGSPALIALADALEIPQTYGEDPSRFRTILAGGRALIDDFSGGAEDDTEAAARDVAEAGVGPGDCVVAISASGSTPYVVEGLAEAGRRGALRVAIANNPRAPLFQGAEIAICLDTGPEVVAGSTRMGAGTAQKIVLNMISTGIAIGLGHVHDGHMVSLRADNAKLRERARRMVEEIASVGTEQASEALEAAGGDVKVAVLLATGAASPEEARERLRRKGPSLRAALDGSAR